MREIERIFTNHDKLGEEYFDIRTWPERTNQFGDEVLRNQHIAYLHLYFRYLDETYPIARLLVAVLYAVGFVALLMPSLGVFKRVFGILVRTAHHSFASFF